MRRVYLDELFVNIQGRRRHLWRAVDQDGDLIDILVQSIHPFNRKLKLKAVVSQYSAEVIG